MKRYWFDAVLPDRTVWAVAVVLAVWSLAALGFASAFGGFDPTESADERTTAFGASLFFACLNGLGMLMGAVVLRRCRERASTFQFDREKPADDRNALLASIGRTSSVRTVNVFGAGLILGLIHVMILQGSLDVSRGFGSVGAAAGSVGTLLTWLIVTSVVAAFIDLGGVLASLSERHLAIDLLMPEHTYRFGRTALLPTVALVGTQMLYPLLSLDGSINLSAVLPGFLVTVTAAVFLFLRSIWPVHRRLQALKAEAIAHVDAVLEAERNAIPGADTMQRLGGIIAYRDYFERLESWPFRMTTALRWMFYLLIPPMTWVGAALMENVVVSVWPMGSRG